MWQMNNAVQLWLCHDKTKERLLTVQCVVSASFPNDEIASHVKISLQRLFTWKVFTCIVNGKEVAEVGK